ncbi:MAG: hypothetical protein ACRCZR_09105 [Cetobacterium sp.]
MLNQMQSEIKRIKKIIGKDLKLSELLEYHVENVELQMSINASEFLEFNSNERAILEHLEEQRKSHNRKFAESKEQEEAFILSKDILEMQKLIKEKQEEIENLKEKYCNKFNTDMRIEVLNFVKFIKNENYKKHREY